MWLKKIKRKLLNQSLKKLYNTVEPEDILRFEKGQLLLKGKLLPEQTVKNLIEESKTLEDMLLWKILTDYVKGTANQRIYNDSVCDDDIIFPKACLKVVQIQKDLVAKIKILK